MAFKRRYNKYKSVPKAHSYNPVPNEEMPKGEENIRHFSSWSKFTDYLETEKSNSHNTSSSDISYHRNEFSKTESFPEAIALAKSGYSEIVPGIMSRLTSIEHLLHKNDTEECLYMDVYSPCGIYDMGAVCGGVPENAVNLFERENDDKNGNTVVINFDATVSASYDAQDLTNRGSVVVALVYALEMSGYSVKVNCVYQVIDGERLLCNVINVKEYTEPLDMPVLAFQLAHPSSLRRLAFRALEIQGIVNSGYGYPITEFRTNRGYFQSCPKDEIFIPGDFPSSNYETVESSTEYIQEKIKEISERYK